MDPQRTTKSVTSGSAVMLVFTLGLTALVFAPSSLQADGVPEGRLAKLRRGVNASHWFAQVLDPRGYTPGHFDTHTTAEDLSLMKSVGFDHVRLSVAPEPMFTPGRADVLSMEYVTRLDRVIRMILAHDLAVVVDMHPSGEFKRRLATDNGHVEAFADFWRVLARHLSALDAERVFLEVLNEPEFDDGYRWGGVQAKLVAAMRQGAPLHTIIVTGHRWSALDELLFLEPLGDRNVVYNFHFYAPTVFTHQGSTWGLNFWRYAKGVPYPSTPDNVSTALPDLPDEQARLQVIRYGHEKWSSKRIEAEIAEVAAWSRKHNLRVMCNEFGVHRRFVDPLSRALWISDVRTALEGHDIGWTVWDYAGDFGVVTKEGEQRVPDVPVLEALGLRSTPGAAVGK